MSLRYAHTLIPTSPEFIASCVQVQAFLTAMMSLGAVGGDNVKFVLRIPSNRFRAAINPFTGETESHRMKDIIPLANTEAIASSISGLQDYDAELSGRGRPKTPPLPLDFTNPYHVGITCRQSSKVCSTSDLHEESGSDIKLPFYGTPSDGAPTCGYFTNPQTMEVIEVPGAGRACFWIEFALGNGLFPRFDRTDLELLNPAIVTECARLFQTSFAQGCQWG